MKRNTSLVTISLPPQMLRESEKIAQKQNMTRSELLRTALRRYLEEASKKIPKKKLLQLEKEDARLWKKIEKDYRRIRSELVKERYPYLFK
ncbi:MAG: ribbon-helix-helix protein, CopG family [Candidatus Doudnabacteria bacterium]|nr:ribbon-helix-helix protein, CopG family [Candidatus Doudnabacteria bacterium]